MLAGARALAHRPEEKGGAACSLAGACSLALRRPPSSLAVGILSGNFCSYFLPPPLHHVRSLASSSERREACRSAHKKQAHLGPGARMASWGGREIWPVDFISISAAAVAGHASLRSSASAAPAAPIDWQRAPRGRFREWLPSGSCGLRKRQLPARRLISGGQHASERQGARSRLDALGVAMELDGGPLGRAFACSMGPDGRREMATPGPNELDDRTKDY